MREGEKTIFSVIVGNTVPSQIKAYLDSLHCYVNWTLSVYTKCAESGDVAGIKILLSEILVMKINCWIKQKVCNVQILVQQYCCLNFFRHHKYSHKTAVILYASAYRHLNVLKFDIIDVDNVLGKESCAM